MKIKEIVDKHGKTPDKLIEIMLDIQERSGFNCLSREDIAAISKEMDIPESRVYSVASFYTLLSTEPRGKYIIQLCHDVPCYINGSVNALKVLEEELGVKIGETTKDKIFTLEFTSCLGCCEIAPVMQIGEEVYGNLTSSKIKEVLNELRGKA